jgi:ribulose-5-phosphate 4-epimerase/fuculose-1-phosphate aldolase
LPYERAWDEVTASDVVTIDLDGHKIAGPGTVRSPIVIHTEFHRARPGVDVTIHQHPKFATIWSACGRVPPAYDQRSALLATDEIAFYDDYKGPVRQLEAAKAAVDGMGTANVALLRNHGAFVVGDSIPQAFQRAVSLEYRCQQAWYVEAIGGGSPMSEAGQLALIESVRARGGVLPMLWVWAVRREIRLDPAVIE